MCLPLTKPCGESTVGVLTFLTAGDAACDFVFLTDLAVAFVLAAGGETGASLGTGATLVLLLLAGTRVGAWVCSTARAVARFFFTTTAAGGLVEVVLDAPCGLVLASGTALAVAVVEAFLGLEVAMVGLIGVGA